MQKIIGVTELQRHFRAVFEDVAERNIPYVLTRGSRPEAVLVSYEEFLRLQDLREQGVRARFDRLTEQLSERNACYSDEEIEADVEAARKELLR